MSKLTWLGLAGGGAAFTLLLGCQAQTAAETGTLRAALTTTIPIRVFTTSPSLGAKPTSVSDPTSPDYGALKVFFEKAEQYTGGAVTFEIASWAPTSPNTVLQQVGINNDNRDAAYDNGGALNPVWGFVYNSVPFGLSFDLMVKFLYEEGGLSLAQSILDAHNRNVKILPVVGSNPQGSGYFKHPVGKAWCNGEADCRKESGIGLEGVCQAGWTWRYLPPPQYVLQTACKQLKDEGIISEVKFNVYQASGGVSFLPAVQNGTVTAFEFATALDDYDPPPHGSGFFPALPTSGPVTSTYQNPGHKGLRFFHSPQWHQPFYMGWVIINKSSLWNTLDPSQQSAIEQAARDALQDSFQRSASVQCDALSRMFAHNNGQVQLNPDGSPVLVDGQPVSADMKWAEWPDAALDRLQAATQVYLDSLKGSAGDNADFTTVITALRSYMDRIHYKWKRNKFTFPDQCPKPQPQ